MSTDGSPTPRWSRVAAVVGASDPGLVRLRTAGRTVSTLVVAAGVVVGLATLAGQSVLAAFPGVIVAMLATFAVHDPTLGGRTVSTAVLAASGAVAAAVSSVLGAYPQVGIAVFVAVAVAAVFAQRLGPRGTTGGMVAFIAYLIVNFLRVPPAQIPAMVVAVALGAGISLAMYPLLRARRPEPELRRMLAALAVRGAAVLDALADAAEAPAVARGTQRRLAARRSRSGQTAELVENRLDGAEGPALAGVENDALSVRVFDFQLGLDYLVDRVLAVTADPGLPDPARTEIAAHLRGLREALLGDDRSAAGRWERLARHLDDARSGLADTPDEQKVARLRHTMAVIVEAWRRPLGPAVAQRDSDSAPEESKTTDPATADSPPSVDDVPGDRHDADIDSEDTNEDSSESPPVSTTLQRALQAGVATALAIGLGELLSPTRWLWAVIAAFVVFVGTSSRGEILTKGWQRVIGTLAGVFAGIAVAVLVGDHTVLAVALIATGLALGFYLMAVSPALMMFFITTVLALVYGLLGRFSVGLLVLRLEETAIGTAVGVVVSFVLFPTRTRSAVTAATTTFLKVLQDTLDDAAMTLTNPTRADNSGPAPARALRESYAALRTTGKPLTEGLAGIIKRPEFRRTQLLAGACEYHARALARLAHHRPGGLRDPRDRAAAEQAVGAINTRIASMREALDSSEDTPHIRSDDNHAHDRMPELAGGRSRPPQLESSPTSSAAALDVLDDAVRAETARTDPSAPPGLTAAELATVAEHLRAVDNVLIELRARLVDAAPDGRRIDQRLALRRTTAGRGDCR